MRECYAFGPFELDPAERRLRRNSTGVPLAPKAFDLLLALVRRAGALVSKRALLDTVWPDAFVEEGILTVYVAAIRKALGETSHRRRYVETVPRHGYRFVAPVTTITAQHDQRATSGSHSSYAHHLVEQGREQMLGSHPALTQAVTTFQAAIAADGAYAAAYAALAHALCTQAQVRRADVRTAYDAAKAAALRALALDDRCGEAQLALGTVLLFSEWDWKGAERSLRRALALDPCCTEAHVRCGNLFEALGGLDEALEYKRRALECSPSSPFVFTQLCLSYFHRRQYEDAIAWGRRAVEQDPTQGLAGSYVALSYWAKGQQDAFVGEIARMAAMVGRPLPCADLESVKRFLLDTDTPGGAMRLAAMKGAMGQLSEAFHHLDAAMTLRDPAIIYLDASPLWDPLRGDSRFDACRARLRLPPTRP